MIICPFCGFKNRPGAFFCDDCGQALHEDPGTMTMPTRQIELVNSEINAKSSWGTASFDAQSTVMLHIRDVREPLQIRPAARMTIGRNDAATDTYPDVDLTPYGAMEKGVSRIHAALLRTEESLTLVDLGSSNGTHLNGQRLIAEQPRVLRDGDEIRFGKLVAHIYFQSR